MMHVRNDQFFQNYYRQQQIYGLAIFANSFCVYCFDQFIVPIKFKYDRKYRHLGSGNLDLQAAIYVTNSFLVAIVLHVHCTYSHVLSHNNTHAWLVN